MKKPISLVLCCFVFNVFFPTVLLAEDTKTSIVRITETRRKTYDRTKSNSSDFMGLELTLKLKGDNVRKATKYGKIKVEKAEDNRGNALVRQHRYSSGRNRLRPLFRNTYGRRNQPPPDDEAEISLNFNALKRNATTIAVLEGSVTLGMATTEDIVLPVDRLNNLVGKKIQNATLEKMGVVVSVKSFQSAPGNYLKLEVTGKSDLVSNVKLVDSKGKALNIGNYSMNYGKKIMILLSGRKALPEGLKLVIPVETSLKEIVVKFRLTDIPLP